MPADHLERLAELSIARGCGFAGLAIVCIMVGFAFAPVFAFGIGGGLCLVMAGVLLAKASHAPALPHRRTEVWVMLEKDERPPDGIAQPLIARVRRRACLKWADISARFAVGLFAGAILVRVIGPAGG